VRGAGGGPRGPGDGGARGAGAAPARREDRGARAPHGGRTRLAPAPRGAGAAPGIARGLLRELGFDRDDDGARVERRAWDVRVGAGVLGRVPVRDELAGARDEVLREVPAREAGAVGARVRL